MLQYIDEEIFSGSLLFSGKALLNWFAKSPNFDQGFNNNELSKYFTQQLDKFLNIKDQK